MSKSNDDQGELPIVIFAAVAAIFLFVSLSGILLGVTAGKEKNKILSWAAPISILCGLFFFWGVPYVSAPSWSAVEEFRTEHQDAKPYFASVSDIKNEIKWKKEEVDSTLKDIDQYKNDLKDDYEFYSKEIRGQEKNLIKFELELEELKAALLKARFRTDHLFNFESMVERKMRPYLDKHHERTLYGYLWFIFSYLVSFFIFRSVEIKKGSVFDKMDKVGSLLCLPGFAIVYVLELMFGIKSQEDKRKILNHKEMFVFGTKHGFLSNKSLALHTQVVGGSGVGKTNFLKSFISDRVSQGKGLIFLDFKADFEVLEWMQGLCIQTDRSDIKVFSLSDSENSISYNPVEFGSATEIVSQLMNSFNWSEEYYKNYAENVLLMSLNLLCHIRDRDDEKFHLGHILKVLTNSKYRYSLLSKAKNYRYRDDVAEVFEELDEKKSYEKVSGLVIQLKKILYSNAGDIFTTNTEQFEPLKFRDAIQRGEIVYLFMNSMSLKEVASSVGKLILQDLMKEVGHIYDSRSELSENMSVVIDEFASFATPDFINFLDKARGAGVELMLAHQSMSDLKEISDNFGTRILENTASKVIFNTQSPSDAEMFAGIVGTYEGTEDTVQVDKGGFFGALFEANETGMGSRRRVERFNIHPNVFKNLRQGEAVVMASKVNPHFGVTHIGKAPEFDQVVIDWKFMSNKLANCQRYIDLKNEEIHEPRRLKQSSVASIGSDGVGGI